MTTEKLIFYKIQKNYQIENEVKFNIYFNKNVQHLRDIISKILIDAEQKYNSSIWVQLYISEYGTTKVDNFHKVFFQSEMENLYFYLYQLEEVEEYRLCEKIIKTIKNFKKSFVEVSKILELNININSIDQNINDFWRKKYKDNQVTIMGEAKTYTFQTK